MLKNVIITTLSYIVISLMVQKPENVDVVVKDVFLAKHIIEKTFTKEFSVHEDIDDELNGEIIEETWFDEK